MKEDKKEETVAKGLGLIVGVFLGGLFWMWINHVWTGFNLGYWQLVLFGLMAWLARLLFKPLEYVAAFLLASTLIIQRLHWIHVIDTLPIIRR